MVLTLDGLAYKKPRSLDILAQVSEPGPLTSLREMWPEESRFNLPPRVGGRGGRPGLHVRTFFHGRRQARTYWETVVSPIRAANGTICNILAVARDVTTSVETHDQVAVGDEARRASDAMLAARRISHRETVRGSDNPNGSEIPVPKPRSHTRPAAAHVRCAWTRAGEGRPIGLYRTPDAPVCAANWRCQRLRRRLSGLRFQCERRVRGQGRLDGDEEFGRLNRLGYVTVHARPSVFLDLMSHDVCRQRDDRCALQAP